MSRWRNSGGWNKSHGTVERVPRIDSFEAKEASGWGTLFAFGDGKMLAFDCDRFTDCWPDRELIELWHPMEGWSQTIELQRKENGFGGSQVFFLCPACGGRRRFLYLTGATFLCRECARLNYKTQQETRSDSMYFFRKGCDLVEKHLDTWPRVRPDGFSFCAWIPERPRYMHKSTYRRYLARFLRYRKKHADRQIEDIQRILKICGR